jgi:hypothetical protein
MLLNANSKLMLHLAQFNALSELSHPHLGQRIIYASPFFKLSGELEVDYQWI